MTSRSIRDTCNTEDLSMVLAVTVALPVAFVAGMAIRDVRLWRRQFRHMPALPELPVELARP
jgi:DUF1365 family protein